MKIVAKFNVQKVSFRISETELSNWQNSLCDVDDDKDKSKEEQKIPEENKNQKPKGTDGKSCL